MNLFEMKDWELSIVEQAWGILAFKKLLTRDKSKGKTRSHLEMQFIWHYTDVKSTYQYIIDLEVRTEEIKKDIGLPKTWKIDKDVQAAIDLYEERSSTIIEALYKQTLKSASAIGEYLGRTKELLDERDNQGKIITDISKITGAVSKMPKLMHDLKAAYKEVVKEQEEADSKKKGVRTFNTFEDGI
jgi:hypothetical protein